MAPLLHEWKNNSSSLSELRTCWKRPQAIHNCQTFILRALAQRMAFFVCVCVHEYVPQAKKQNKIKQTTKKYQTRKQQLPEPSTERRCFHTECKYHVVNVLFFRSRTQSNRHVLVSHNDTTTLITASVLKEMENNNNNEDP